MRKWTEDSLKNASLMFESGSTYKEIAEKFGSTEKGVRMKLNKLGYFQSIRSKEQKKDVVYEDLICLNCGKYFTAYKRHKQKFCSQSCNASFNNKRRERENTFKKKSAVCSECGEKIEVSIFASLKTAKCKKCKPDYGESRRYIKDVSRVHGVYACLNCGKELVRKAKYCSHDCQIKFAKRKIFSKIESGDANVSHKQYKKYLIEKYGEKCMECGWHEKNIHSDKIPIELEHIDGNSENNDLKNLKLLCPNCHSLTPTYKALNAGHGRHKRMVRYKEGKSY